MSSLSGIPYVEVYRKLHQFLKKWEKKKTKQDFNWPIVDGHLEERANSPSNTYNFIERIVASTIPDSSVMSYNIADVSLQAEVYSFRE